MDKARESEQKDEDYGYGLFPKRKEGKYKKGSLGESLFTFHNKCQVMLHFALETSTFLNITHAYILT